MNCMNQCIKRSSHGTLWKTATWILSPIPKCFPIIQSPYKTGAQCNWSSTEQSRYLATGPPLLLLWSTLHIQEEKYPERNPPLSPWRSLFLRTCYCWAELVTTWKKHILWAYFPSSPSPLLICNMLCGSTCVCNLFPKDIVRLCRIIDPEALVQL